MEEDDKKLISLARKTIEIFLRDRKKIDIENEELPAFTEERSGVFTTLKKHGQLRGCIGFPEPVYPLREAIVDSAISAAVKDPRFPPVSLEELTEIELELTILSPPKKIEVKDPAEYLQHIKIGRDGLIISKGPFRGLLLPQVPVEWEWDVRAFLEHTCRKAGLPIDAWMHPDTEIYKFEGRVIHEK
ncbi:MAG: TIGR00296 family protein [Candidatus Hodarchaeales archaeon]